MDARAPTLSADRRLWVGQLALCLAQACTQRQDPPREPPPIPSQSGQPGAGTSANAAVGNMTSAAAKGLAGTTANAGTQALSTKLGAGTQGSTLDAGSSARSDDDAGATMPASADDPAANGSIARSMQPIAAPLPDDCITDVSAGDHTFSCDEISYLTLIDPMCTRVACGLIFDIHGATMSGAQMRDSTQLYWIAPKQGYIVVNPSATPFYTGGSWDLTSSPPKLANFMERMIKAFHVDTDRVHVGGFSQGSTLTYWFLCNRHDLIASAAPIAGTGNVDCIDEAWKPRVPIFYVDAARDQSAGDNPAHTMMNSIVEQLQLTGGMQIAGDTEYSRKHWEGSDGMALDYLEHHYAGQALLDGDCVPGGVDVPSPGTNNFGLNASTCLVGDIRIKYGDLALQWYLDHPRTQP
jgi:pimeloyl-ACP methyl ester carboxylesterase